MDFYGKKPLPLCGFGVRVTFWLILLDLDFAVGRSKSIGTHCDDEFECWKRKQDFQNIENRLSAGQDARVISDQPDFRFIALNFHDFYSVDTIQVYGSFYVGSLWWDRIHWSSHL